MIRTDSGANLDSEGCGRVAAKYLLSGWGAILDLVYVGAVPRTLQVSCRELTARSRLTKKNERRYYWTTWLVVR